MAKGLRRKCMRTLLIIAVIFLWAYAATGENYGNGTSVEICDSSSCRSIVDSSFTEISLAETDSIVDGVVGDPKMDMLAESLDNDLLLGDNIAVDRDIGMSNSAVGSVHINWLSGSGTADNLTIIVSLDRFIQIWGNSTQGAISTDKPPLA